MSGVRAPHLQRRNGVYHLRMRVPDDVRLRLGRGEVRRSLGTYAFGTARSLAARYAAHVTEAFVVIKHGNFTIEQARDLVQNCFSDLIAETESYGGYIPQSDQPDLEKNEQLGMSQDRVAALRTQLGTAKFAEYVRKRAVQLTSPIDFESLSKARSLDIQSGIARALIEDQRLFQLRLEDRLAPFHPADSLFIELNAAPPTSSISEPTVTGPKVGYAIDGYLNAHENQWVKKTHQARRWQLRYLREHLGEARPLTSITALEIRAYRDAVQTLRANHGRTPTQTFSEKQTPNVDHRIATKTARLIFEATKAFFGWCKSNEGLIEVNPASDVTMPIEKTAKGKKSRRPFTTEELHLLFSAPLYTGCRSVHRRGEPGSKSLIRN